MKKTPTTTKKSNNYNGYNNRPYKLPSPEEMSDELMSFTYNPKITPTDKGKINMPLYYNELVQIFRSLQYAKVKLWHEISCTGKWHLHGLIKISNKMKFTMFDFAILQQDGVFEIDTISDYEHWVNVYCNKQQHLMQPILDEYKIPYEINSMEAPLKLKKIDPIYSMAKCPRIEPETSSDDYDMSL